MIGFKEFMKNEAIEGEIYEKFALLMYLAENNQILNESYDMENLTESQKEQIFEGIKDWFEKVGLSIEKGTGIIDYVGQFTSGAGKLILAAIKGDKEKVKEIAKGLKKEKVIDFLLKLDILTLHLVTGPIHTIDAVTGWELMANLEKFSDEAADQIKIFYKHFTKVKSAITNLFKGKDQAKMLGIAKKLEKNIPNK